MATDFIGLSAASKGVKTRTMKCATAGLKEGAVVIHDSSADGNKVKAPTAAANTGIAGVIWGQQPSSGTSAGDDVEVAYEGIVPVQLDATEAVTVGGKVIISDTDGSVKALGTTDSCDILGVTEITKTAGAANELIPVRIQIQFVGDNVP
jgi:predicted RecA/RadA family phage recombinase